MARITVEDCLEKIDNQYDLVLLAKERTAQLNAGSPSLVSQDNDKNTVISLREIGEGKLSIETLEDSAINKLTKQQEETTELEELDDEHEDSFDKIYKGQVSKSGTAILPSKRTRRIPEKAQANKVLLLKKDEEIEEIEENEDNTKKKDESSLEENKSAE